MVVDVFRVGELFFEYKDYYLYLINVIVLVFGSINGDILLKFLVGVIILFIFLLLVVEEEYGFCYFKLYIWILVRIRFIFLDFGWLLNIFVS